jgi:4-amino-4-deoxy-L-arabinose transferase-like glycosyltransferase
MALTQTHRRRLRAPFASREARLLAGLVVLAATLRFATLDVQSLDGDEAYTAEIAARSLGGALGQIPDTESTPPLYYLLAWLWTKVAGSGEAGLRSLSALAGTVAVPAVYAIGAALRSRRAGLAAAAFAAVSPLLVWYSQEARAYMLFMLLATVAFWTFVRALREPRWLVWWALASAAALATHYFAAVTVVPMAVWLLVRAPRRQAAAAVAAVGAVGLALTPLALHQSEHVSRPWADVLSSSDGLLATSQSFLVGIVWTWLIHRPGVIALALVSLGLLVLLWRRGDARDHRAAALPAAIAAVALLVPFVSSLAGPKYFTPGNELAVWPLLAVILAVGATARRAGRVGLGLAAAACVLMLAITIAGPLDDDLQRDDWRDVVGTLNDTPATRAIDVLNREDTRVVRYYLDRETPPRPTREIVVLGRPTGPIETYFVLPLPGMRGIGFEQERKLAYARYEAPDPVTVPGHVNAVYQSRP